MADQSSDAAPAYGQQDYRNAIGTIESDNNYGSLGPPTSSGDRAYGRYQVMGSNVPDWTEKYYGTRLTPSQFLTNQDAQDAVFDGEFGGAVKKYGNPQDAASVWFSGRPLSQAGNASDGYNTVPQYVAKFNKALGAGPPSPQTAQANSPAPANAPVAQTAPGMPQTPYFPPQTMPQMASGGQLPAYQQPAPLQIQYAQRRPVDLSRLRAQLATPVFSQG